MVTISIIAQQLAGFVPAIILLEISFAWAVVNRLLCKFFKVFQTEFMIPGCYQRLSNYHSTRNCNVQFTVEK